MNAMVAIEKMLVDIQMGISEDPFGWRQLVENLIEA